MPYSEVPAFVARLREPDSDEISRLGFEFLILTASRTSEVLQARWNEVDADLGLWIVPAARMKAGREHRVPLSAQCIAIIERARALAAAAATSFPGSRSKSRCRAWRS